MGDARDTEKAPDAFRTISEVADDLDLPQHVLRFWESRFSQIRPVKRAGGRRFYRPEDVDLLRGIRHLLYTDGYTIKGAQRILKDQGVRFVQDLGVDREVAVMRTAKPAGGEGVTFGGLLGLIPRRRGKGRGGEDDGLPELPETAELPLPFPDAEADRDLSAEAPVASIPLRPAGRGREGAERRDPGFDAPAPSERGRREPPLGAPPRPSPPPAAAAHGDHEDDDRSDDYPASGHRAFDHRAPDHRAPEPPRARPAPSPASTARPPERVEPVLAARPPQRPSRGPAARLSRGDDDTAYLPPDAEASNHAPELDDPLLPFLEEIPSAPQVSEPIEDRIRRLRSLERRPQRPHEWPEDASPAPRGGRPDRRDPPEPDDRGPPEEYVLARARRAEAYPPPELRPEWPEEEPRHRRSRPIEGDDDGFEPGRPSGRRDTAGRLLRDGDWRQTDWVDAAEDGPDDRRPHYDDDPAEAPLPRYPGRPHARRPVADEFADPPAPLAVEPEYPMTEQERPRAPAPRQNEGRREPPLAAPARAPGRGYDRPDFHEADAVHRPLARPERPASARPDEALRRAWDESWGDSPPQALPRAARVGPLIGPIQDEFDEDHSAPVRPDHSPQAPMPLAEQRMLAERLAGRQVPPNAGFPAREAPPPEHGPRQAPWSRTPQMPAAAPAAPQDEAAARMPREPLRQGPPEQYLPPHLRSEPRVVGQAPMAAPVLSRDDVHRMQSALYELGECRRLMESILARRGEARAGD